MKPCIMEIFLPRSAAIESEIEEAEADLGRVVLIAAVAGVTAPAELTLLIATGGGIVALRSSV